MGAGILDPLRSVQEMLPDIRGSNELVRGLENLDTLSDTLPPNLSVADTRGLLEFLLLVSSFQVALKDLFVGALFNCEIERRGRVEGGALEALHMCYPASGRSTWSRTRGLDDGSRLADQPDSRVLC